MLARVIIGALGTIIGFVFVWKSEWFFQNFGRIPWAEEHLGISGGTRFFYKLIGVLIIILAWFIMFGWLQDILVAIFVR